ncbi:hypothetical protein BDV97DRAFT_398822 [Delphinella strobiligena]|nr:hypothetical protein BDV97DRAFT_398822 [Delphinella strobiligena]
MGCFGDKEKGDVDESQKWMYLTLSDFTASGALAYFSYGWLWFLAIVAVAVYGADTFTAVNLLAFDKWSSQIQPTIPLEYSKWIFTVCIIISWVLCAFEWVRAIRVIRRGSVAESYMDPLAVTLQSMRPQGWKRFLVFAELTKSKKGVDYIALFVYFQLKSALRIILAEAPRQVVNGMTLYSFLKADLVPTGSHASSSGRTDGEQFFVNIGTLWNTDHEETVVLFTMLFTFIIWVISALSLIAAVVLYLTFLWHYVPQKDGRLSIYCRRKIDRRLEKIVGVKVKQALEHQEKKQTKMSKNTQRPENPARKATLPQVAAVTPRFNEDKLPEFKLAREDSQATMSSFASQSTRDEQSRLTREPTIPDTRVIGARRPGMAYRSATETSNASYSSDAPLIGNATEMGYIDDDSDDVTHPRPVPDRQLSASSYGSRPILDRQTSASPYGSNQFPDRNMSATPYASRPLPDRQMSASSYGSNQVPLRQISASPYVPGPVPDRQMSASPYNARPVADRQMSASSRGPRAPIMRSMTPLTEVSHSVDERSEIMEEPFDENEPGMQPKLVTETVPTQRQIPQESYRSFSPPARAATAIGGGVSESLPHSFKGPVRHNTEPNLSRENDPAQRQVTQDSYRPFFPGAATGLSGRQDPRPESASETYEMMSRPTPAFLTRRNPSLTSSDDSFEMTSQPPSALLPGATYSQPPSRGGYVAFNPVYAGLGSSSQDTSRLVPAANAGKRSSILQRSATAPPEAAAYDDCNLIDEYRRRTVEAPTRSATAGPGKYEPW